MEELLEMPTEWDCCLAIVPHPDDMEYGASAAVAAWTDAGKSVSYLLVTRGEAGIDDLEPAEAAALRAEEQRAACTAVGVETLEFLDFPDGTIEYGLPLRRALAAAIRRHRPELVVTVNHRDTYPGGGFNMADHRVTGLAVLDAVRDAANRWVFTDLADDGLQPWGGVRWVAMSGVAAVVARRRHHRHVRARRRLPRRPPPLPRRPSAMVRWPTPVRSCGRWRSRRPSSFGGRLSTSFELIAM